MAYVVVGAILVAFVVVAVHGVALDLDVSLFADVVAFLAVRLDVVAAVAGGTAHLRPHFEAHVVFDYACRCAAVVVAAVVNPDVVDAVVPVAVVAVAGDVAAAVQAVVARLVLGNSVSVSFHDIFDDDVVAVVAVVLVVVLVAVAVAFVVAHNTLGVVVAVVVAVVAVHVVQLVVVVVGFHAVLCLGVVAAVVPVLLSLVVVLGETSVSLPSSGLFLSLTVLPFLFLGVFASLPPLTLNTFLSFSSSILLTDLSSSYS